MRSIRAVGEANQVDKNYSVKDQQFTPMTNYVQMEMRPSPLEHAHGEIFDYPSQVDESPHTHSTGFNLLERANQRVFHNERLEGKLREEIEQMQGSMNASPVTNNHSVQTISQDDSERKLREKLEHELARKDVEIATLVLDGGKLQSALLKISDLQTCLTEKDRVIAQLQDKLQSQADYEDIKRQWSAAKSLDEQPGISVKKPLEVLLLEKSRALNAEQTSSKLLPIDPESHLNHQSVQQSCLNCSSSSFQRMNPPCLPIPSLLSSSASSSSNSSSSPSSPSQIFLKAHVPSISSHESEETNKFISPLPLSPLTSKYPSIPSSCSTMVTPTASLLSSVSTPSNLFAGQQISSVQCTKLHCPPTSSWSPPLSSSSDVSTIATTSTDNINSVTRTVIKPSKPSAAPLALSTCPPISTSNHILEPLDTNYVANIVRKLLAQHNIGQRIFARYILSLSQGTVSELLSKPKCWSKLTEKGKESYRKMWCWANSEESILTLKSISPRKGMNNRSKDNPYPAVSTKHTDPATQQKIVQILADAQKQQMAAAAAAAAANMDQKASLSPCGSLPNDSSHINLLSNSFESRSYLSQTPSSSSSTSSASSAGNSPSHDSTLNEHQSSFLLPVPPPPMPSSSSTAASLNMFSSFVPSLLMRTANGFNTEKTGNLIDCANTSPFNLLCHPPDNYRNWLMLQEIVRNNDLLKQFKPVLPPPMEMGDSEQENHADDDDEDDEDEEEMDDENNQQYEHENGLNEDEDDDERESDQSDSEGIPLDLSMKIDSGMSDTTQTSRPSTHHKPSSSTKHTKTALTPLREQDTLKYRYINTIELVQTVKDILSRYSISQRHFGEKILGLSQGSVSDILARPKPWELLTQKGREPFLRMRIFLDDSNAINQLVQTVATTPTSNTTSILVPTYFPSIPPSSSILSTPSLLSSVTMNGFHPNNLLLRDLPMESQSNLLSTDAPAAPTNDTLPMPPSSTPPTASNSVTTKARSRSKSSKTNIDKPPASSHSRSLSANPLMAPYELPKIALPSSIDTEHLSAQVRELLFAYSIGQRVFGEAVLNLSQGTVSEILSKPRSWHSLSVKGREPYIRMYTWFQDKDNVQKLLAWKRERDALRRSRPPVATPKAALSSTTNESADGEGTNSAPVLPTGTPTSSSRSKRRSLFTEEQRRVLKQIFSDDPYPSQATLEQLVSDLSLPMSKVANWFHNSRMRAKTSMRPPASPLNQLSSSALVQQSDEEDDFVDNNNNPNNDDEEEEDVDSDENYSGLPTIVPLTSSWLNGTHDSNSSTSPTGLSTSSTHIVSLIDDPKTVPAVTSSSSSSSKKRKSVPQKIITSSSTLPKKFNNGSTIMENESYNASSNDETTSINQTTNDSGTFVDILS